VLQTEHSALLTYYFCPEYFDTVGLATKKGEISVSNCLRMVVNVSGPGSYHVGMNGFILC